MKKKKLLERIKKLEKVIKKLEKVEPVHKFTDSDDASGYCRNAKDRQELRELIIDSFDAYRLNVEDRPEVRELIKKGE